ncbi:hypothetical protein ACFQU2_18095 [Siccirubricoccus deserti]
MIGLVKALLLIGGAALGAGALSAPPASAQGQQQPAAATVVRIDGSTGVAPLVSALAREYERRTPGALIKLAVGWARGRASTRSRLVPLTSP